MNQCYFNLLYIIHEYVLNLPNLLSISFNNVSTLFQQVPRFQGTIAPPGALWCHAIPHGFQWPNWWTCGQVDHTKYIKIPHLRILNPCRILNLTASFESVSNHWIPSLPCMQYKNRNWNNPKRTSQMCGTSHSRSTLQPPFLLATCCGSMPIQGECGTFHLRSLIDHATCPGDFDPTCGPSSYQTTESFFGSPTCCAK